MNWYYANGQERLGPITEEAFVQLVSQGQIQADTLVWKEGMPNWLKLMEVRPELLTTPGTGEDSAICAVSGKAYPKKFMIQYQDKWISAEHRDLFFQRLREGVSAPGVMNYDGFGIRFGAKLIDSVIVMVISWIKDLLLMVAILGQSNIFAPKVDPKQIGLLLTYQGISFLLSLLIGVAFNWFFLSRYQATPGKIALGLKVVRADGGKLNAGRIIGRYFSELLSSIILCIGYIMVAFDEPERRALHDRICDTRVVKK